MQVDLNSLCSWWSRTSLHPEKGITGILFYGFIILLHKTFWLYDFLDFPLLQATIPLKCEMYLQLTKAMSHPTSLISLRLEEVTHYHTEYKASWFAPSFVPA